MEGTKSNDEEVRGLGKELGVHEHGVSALASHVEGGDNVLTLGLTSISLCLMEKPFHEVSVLAGHFLLSGEFSGDMLLLHLSLHLILGIKQLQLRLSLVLNSLAA